MFKIAIDGPAGAGKSTISKEIAKKLNIEYLDTGAMYRAVTLKAMRLGVNMEDDNSYDFLKDTSISIVEGKFYLDGEDVSTAIRSVDVTNNVSTPSKIGCVRSYLVDLQRKISESIDVVMDGRDIGTVVLPNAQCKLFITASNEVRAQRRLEQLKGTPDCPTYDQILQELYDRDYKDINREHGALLPAEDSIIIDNSNETLEQTLDRCEKIVKEIKNK